MNVFSRGVRNAFRNSIRTFSIIIILGISVGLALTMLVARAAVEAKIDSVKRSLGTTITISPAGFTPGSSANNALTTSDLAKVKSVAHITGITETLTDRLSTTGSSQPSFGPERSSSSKSSTTSLKSPITLNSNGGQGGGRRIFVSGGGTSDSTTMKNFSLPVSFLGTNDPSTVDGASITIKSGKTISGSTNTKQALVSQSMADKNGLKVGSTFTAYDRTLTVTGIFTSSTQGANDTVILSLSTLQDLSDQADVITSATATVDSLDNLSDATSAVKSALGSNADVTSSEEQAESTVKPLNAVRTVAMYSLIGALIAGAVIILLTMMMIVRERRREIGVMKAIGSSNGKTMVQFMSEAVTLTVLGLVVGLLFAVTTASPITNALVSSSNSQSSDEQASSGPGAGAMSRQGGPRDSFRSFNRVASAGVDNLRNIQASVGWSTLGYGVLVSLIIAVIGSAVPAYFISKIRPSEVMRAE